MVPTQGSKIEKMREFAVFGCKDCDKRFISKLFGLPIQDFQDFSRKSNTLVRKKRHFDVINVTKCLFNQRQGFNDTLFLTV